MKTGVVCACGNQWDETYAEFDLNAGFLAVDCEVCGAHGSIRTGLLVDILQPFKKWFD